MDDALRNSTGLCGGELVRETGCGDVEDAGRSRIDDGGVDSGIWLAGGGHERAAGSRRLGERGFLREPCSLHLARVDTVYFETRN